MGIGLSADQRRVAGDRRALGLAGARRDRCGGAVADRDAAVAGGCWCARGDAAALRVVGADRADGDDPLRDERPSRARSRLAGAVPARRQGRAWRRDRDRLPRHRLAPADLPPAVRAALSGAARAPPRLAAARLLSRRLCRDRAVLAGLAALAEPPCRRRRRHAGRRADRHRRDARDADRGDPATRCGVADGTERSPFRDVAASGAAAAGEVRDRGDLAGRAADARALGGGRAAGRGGGGAAALSGAWLGLSLHAWRARQSLPARRHRLAGGAGARACAGAAAVVDQPRLAAAAAGARLDGAADGGAGRAGRGSDPGKRCASGAGGGRRRAVRGRSRHQPARSRRARDPETIPARRGADRRAVLAFPDPCGRSIPRHSRRCGRSMRPPGRRCRQGRAVPGSNPRRRGGACRARPAPVPQPSRSWRGGRRRSRTGSRRRRIAARPRPRSRR